MTIQLGPLVAVAIGNAYGAQFEFRPGQWAALNTGAAYSPHPTHRALKPGCYTYATQMSIAVAMWLCDERFMEAGFDSAFRETYWRDRRVGYSGSMARALHEAKVSSRTLDAVCQQFGKSEESGAAMRATPLGLLPNLHDLFRLARKQAMVTHSGDAVRAAAGVAAAAHYMYARRGQRQDLLKWLAHYMGDTQWGRSWHGPVGAPGMESARAALTATTQATSLRDLLVRCCAFTGDVGTVTAIAMGCAWAYDDLPNDLPDSLWDGLENGAYGRDYLAMLDQQLLAQFCPRLLLPA